MVTHLQRLTLAFLCFTCLVLVPLNSKAEDPRLELSVSPPAGSQGDVFEFSVTVHGAITSQTFPYLKGGDDFQLTLIGPQTSYTFVNGVSTQKTTYLYNLFPKRTGLLNTPGAEIEISGQLLTASPLSVSVAKASKEDVMKQDKATFLVQSVTSNQAYVGEQIAATLKLYSREELTELRVGDLTTKGMLQLSMGDEKHTSRVIEGRRYRVTTLRRALFPLEPGTLVLPEREIVGSRVATQRQRFNPLDPFSGFLGTRQMRPFQVMSNTEEINVIALPQPTKPVFNWNPATPLVGTTSLHILPEPGRLGSEMEVGDDRTVTIKVTSSGNLSNIDSFTLGSSPLIDIYSESPTERQFENSGLLFTEKTFSFSLVAHSPGRVSLPPIRLTYFDQDSRSYRTLEKPAVVFTIQGEPVKQTQSQIYPKNQNPLLTEPPATGDEKNVPEQVPTPPQPQALGERLQIPPSLYLFYIMASGAGLLLVGSVLSFVYTTVKRRRELGMVNHATNPKELLAATQAIVQKRLDKNNSMYVSPEELIRKQNLPPSVALPLLEFFSLCKRLCYGDVKEGHDLPALRQRAYKLLSKLS